MIIFAKFMLLFWVPLTIYWFKKKDPREAVLLSYIGGILFLPNSTLHMPLIVYNKRAAIAIAVLLGEAISNKKVVYRKNFFDNVMITFCFISSIITSVINGYGLYEGFIVGLDNFFTWGVAFITGRKYFSKETDLKLLVKYILTGVLIYVPLCQYELRMSPQLHIKLYGFFQHSWTQHFRYGGYRPIVFMQHGLMVSLWLMVGVVIFFWLWRSKAIKRIFNIPVFILFFISLGTLFMSKSKGALFLGILGIVLWYAYKNKTIDKIFTIFLIALPVYFFLRIQSLITVSDIVNIISHFFDQQRIASLNFRLRSEELITNSMGFFQILLGWHRWGRGVGIDPYTGRPVIVDSLWIVIYGSRGLLGLTSMFLLILSGPITIVKNLKRKKSICLESVVLSLIIILFAYDCLVNAMVNSIYILCTGALVTYGEMNLIKRKKNDVVNGINFSNK